MHTSWDRWWPWAPSPCTCRPARPPRGRIGYILYVYICISIYYRERERWIHTYLCMDTCVCVYIYIYIYMDTCVCIYIYIYVYTHTYICTHPDFQAQFYAEMLGFGTRELGLGRWAAIRNAPNY